MRQFGRVLVALAILVGAVCARPTYVASAAPASNFPRALLSVAYEFSGSDIPIFLPTWLPALPPHPYAVFSTFKSVPGRSPGYNLTLYRSSKLQDHVDELVSITGIEGASYVVNSHTTPIPLGSQGWAYLDPNFGGNAGYSINVVRSVTETVYPEDFTYAIEATCKQYDVTHAQIVACFKHLALSLRRYTTAGLRTSTTNFLPDWAQR